MDLGFDWKDVVQKFLSEQNVNPKNYFLVEKCIQGIIDPVDGGYWCISWRKTPTRLISVLKEKERVYWEVFEFFSRIPSAEIDEWNSLRDMEISKRIRVLGRNVKIAKIYIGGKYLWDFLVLCRLKDNMSIKEVIIRSLKWAGKDFTTLYPGWCIYYLNNRPKEDKKEHGIEVISTGQ